VTAARNLHERFHELLAARVFEPLAEDEAALLEAHLAACPACRSVEREYRHERELLRALPPAPPPRDLWARTSAALDREVAHRPAPLAATLPARRRRSAGLTIGALFSLGLVVAVVSTQLQPVPVGPLAQPTPFSVPPTLLAIVEQDAAGLTIYRTQVDRVCPAPLLDCRDLNGGTARTAAIARLTTDSAPSNIAFGRGQVAITASDEFGHDLYVVAAIDPEETAPAPVAATPTTGGPTASGQATQPPASEPPGSTPPESPPSSTGSAPPDSSPATTTVTPSEPGPSASGAASGNVISPPPNPTAEATLEAVEPTAILSDVIAVGMPAAWSPDGSTLAFSAMPADGSTGPDVYTWQPGQTQATPLTDDHQSYFASWSASRLVVSRAVPVPQEEGVAVSDELLARSFVIDLGTGESRLLGDRLWLPVVDPQAQLVLYWEGRLEAAGTAAQAMVGDLFLASWAHLDPFARSAQGSIRDPDETRRPDPAGATPGRTPRAFRRQLDLGTATDPVEGAVRDWQVAWSGDGRSLGIWLADEPAATTGSLSVLAVDVERARTGRTELLVGPAPARRAFSLGLDRVAWVAPLAGDGDGELRVQTWGPGGKGLVRLRNLDPEDGVPAF
jgi:hypothetical protein